MRKLIFILTLFFSLSASAQDDPIFGLLANDATTPPPTATAFVLDTVTGDQLGVYSLYREKTAYTGPLIRVRNTAATLTYDVYALTSGFLDTTGLYAWMNANGVSTAKFSKWYDQSGNGLDLTALNTGIDIDLIINGVGSSGKPTPTWYLKGAQYFGYYTNKSAFNALHTSQVTVTALAFVYNPSAPTDPNAFYTLMGNNGGTTAGNGYSLHFDDRASSSRNNAIIGTINRGAAGTQVVNDLVTNTWTPNAWTIINHTTDPTNATAAARSHIYINNAAITQTNTFTGAVNTGDATYFFEVGDHGNSANSTVSMWKGYVSKVILHTRQLSSTDRGILNASFNRQYNAY